MMSIVAARLYLGMSSVTDRHEEAVETVSGHRPEQLEA
jgi:hypothetical protein